jgi:TPR repeat protein
MNSSRDFSAAADAASRIASHLERSEQRAASGASSEAWRDPSPLRSDHRNERFDHPQGAATLRASARHPSISPWLFVMATALNTMVAAVLAVIITLGVVRQERTDNPPREVALASAYSQPALAVGSEPGQQVAGARAIELRPIGSPNQPLRLQAQKPAPLPLQIQPEEAARESFILVLSGAPAGTTLSGASRIGSDTWYLSPGSATRLEIALPEWSTSVFEITMALRRTDGLVAAQAKAWIAVPPPASPEAAGSGTDQAAAKDLLAKAERLIERGDIVAARMLYQRAAEMGSGSAALRLGATYDPNRLWSFGALGMVGNRERAKQWYLRASDLGHPDAKARLMALGN